ncbi:MAG: sprT domain-containing protein [Crocinitomicaceae bacterium]|nr:sprT domain-containing protein [Crocinitomicaceae bacterium]
MEKSTKIKKVLTKYVPSNTEDYVASLFLLYPVSFKIVAPRKTKLGDFRAGRGETKSQITVNGNLNEYAFLVTTIHEFAHLKTWIEYKNSVKPHGDEWKRNFILLMEPIIEMKVMPKDIENALINSFVNMKASSCSDIQLNRVLKRYDSFTENEVTLEKLPKYANFTLGIRVFKKGELRRTRYLCTDINSGKQYLIHKLATVEVKKK